MHNPNTYKEYVKTLTDDELHKELWALDVHIQYLNNDPGKDSLTEDAHTIMELFEIAAEESRCREI